MGLRYLLFTITKLFEKRYGIESVTKKGETAKSKAEKHIADFLFDMGIKYIYEPDINDGWWIFKSKVMRPDFYLPKYGVYIEYWGLSHVSERYKEVKKWKLEQYKKRKLKLISLYSKDMKNLKKSFMGKFRKVVGIKLAGELLRNAKLYFQELKKLSAKCPKCNSQMILKFASNPKRHGRKLSIILCCSNNCDKVIWNTKTNEKEFTHWWLDGIRNLGDYEKIVSSLPEEEQDFVRELETEVIVLNNTENVKETK